MKSKAYSYVRFSTLDQIKGDSQRRQTDAAAQWCKRNGVELIQSYKDLGVSAFRGKNAETGALASFLSLVRAGRIAKGSYLIVESLDRISRNSIMEAFDVFRDIIKGGIKLVTLSDGQVYDREGINSNWSSLIISLTVLSRAHEESKTKSQRISQAWSNKRSQIGNGGEKLTAKGRGWLKLSADRKTFEPIPERVAVVRQIFELARAGKGANQIGKILREQGTAPFGRAPAWHTSYVKKILDSRAVIGEFTPAIRRNGEAKFLDPIPNYYPAVVSRELFATVNQMRRARPSFKGRGTFNVFSKLAFDPKGHSMTYVNKDRAKGWHYLVSSAALIKKAEYCTWPYDDFLASFLTLCQKAALAKPPKAGKQNGELAVKQMELVEVEKQIERLVDFLARGTSGAVETKLREAEDRKSELQHQIADLENQAAANPRELSKVDWQDNAALRDNLRATVKRITIDPRPRRFKAEFLDGRTYEFKQDADSVTISSPD